MIEALRRVVIEAELPESLADEVKQALAEGRQGKLTERLREALLEWSHERWEQSDPEGWRAHVDEVRACVAEADAHPEDDMDAATFFNQLRAELDTSPPNRTSAEAAE